MAFDTNGDVGVRNPDLEEAMLACPAAFLHQITHGSKVHGIHEHVVVIR
jgi:hypothetical protein